MSTSQNEPEKPAETPKSQAISVEALNTMVELRQTLIDEVLTFIERNTSSRSDWLLAIAGAGFVAVTLEIILRDFLVDILRGRAKSSRCLN
jgi:NADH dehydrogenase FAD-containing subunit